MFPDSELAAKFACGERKANYVMRFGLAPHFKAAINSDVNRCSAYVLLFDESYNAITKNKQMDIFIRYWTSEERVGSRYIQSMFMGHGRAQDILEHFLAGVGSLELKRVLQVSMDGPNVNWAFHKLLQSKMHHEFGSQMLDIGSCGLHVINGGFKHGSDASTWHIPSLLRSVHSLFNETPARREDYTRATGSEKFCLNYCNTRWLENVPVAERVLEMWPHIKTYVKAVAKNEVPTPTTKAFELIQQSTRDLLIEVKLNAFLSLAKVVTPFLTVYQTDRTMIPFLAGDLHTMLKQLLTRFMKDDFVESLSLAKMTEIDVNDTKSCKSSSKVQLGFTADSLLKQLLLSKKSKVLLLLQNGTNYY